VVEKKKLSPKTPIKRGNRPNGGGLPGKKKRRAIQGEIFKGGGWFLRGNHDFLKETGTKEMVNWGNRGDF